MVAAVFLAVVWWMEKRRSEQLTHAAAMRGMNYNKSGFEPIVEGLGALPLFTHGRWKKAGHAMRGQIERHSVVVFDYRYTIGGGRSSNTYVQTVAAYDLGALLLPPFALEPEGLFDRLGARLGMQDFDFDTHPEFSRNYKLTGSSESAVRELFAVRMLDALQGTSGWNIEGSGSHVIVYRQKKLVAPADLGNFLDETVRMAALFVPR